MLSPTFIKLTGVAGEECDGSDTTSKVEKNLRRKNRQRDRDARSQRGESDAAAEAEGRSTAGETVEERRVRRQEVNND